MTHICVGNLTIIGSDNGLSPGRRQAIIWPNAGILLIGPLGTNFSEIYRNSNIFIQENVFESVFCEIAILSQLQCVNGAETGTAKTIWIMQDKPVLFSRGRISASQCWVIIENINISSCFKKEIPDDKGYSNRRLNILGLSYDWYIFRQIFLS